MSDADLVTEVIATSVLDVRVPLEAGAELTETVRRVVGELRVVRFIELLDLGAVTKSTGELEAVAYCRITFHLEPAVADDPVGVIRASLGDAPEVRRVRELQVETGPYTIERW